MKILPAFTIIELLITMSIIALMAVFVIPAFSNYGDKALFKQRTIEIQSMIEQTNIMSKNPEKGVTRYFFMMNDGSGGSVASLDFSKANATGTGSTLIKTIELPSDYALTLEGGDTSVNHNLKTDLNLVCDSTGSFCCRVTDPVAGTCASTNTLNNEDIFKITRPPTSDSLTFKIYSNPFRVLVY